VSAHWGRRLQYAAVCVLVVAYASLSHYCNAHRAHDLGAALALAPLTLLILVVAWRSWSTLAAIVATAAWGLALFCVWPVMAKNFALFYLIQESSVYGILGATFAGSLRRNKIALCTQLADRVHGPLSPQEVAYTRRVTAAWSIFFFAVAALSIALYVEAPLRIWSIYINFCVMPLVATMFIGEYVVRRRVLPQIKRVGVMASVRIYFASPQ
jgi:uncharacterized membrane protein